jgi:hypothetical protein
MKTEAEQRAAFTEHFGHTPEEGEPMAWSAWQEAATRARAHALVEAATIKALPVVHLFADDDTHGARMYREGMRHYALAVSDLAVAALKPVQATESAT